MVLSVVTAAATPTIESSSQQSESQSSLLDESLFAAPMDAAPAVTSVAADSLKSSAKSAAKEERKKERSHARFEKKQARKQAQREKAQTKAVERAQKEARKYEEQMAKLEPQTIAIYGVGINFLDSTVYVTDYQTLDSVYIEPGGELREYYAYTADYKFFLESHYHLTNETCAVYYMPKSKKADKRFAKMDSYFRKKGFVIARVERDDFQFTRQDSSVDENFTLSAGQTASKP